MVTEAQDDQENQPSQFGHIFAEPTIDHMYALGDRGFEDFIQYVFQCAGYAVEYVGDRHYPRGPGVDLNLYADQVGGRLLARVEVRCFKPDNLLDLGHVNAFLGALGRPRTFHGFLVTTSDFTQPAHLRSKEDGRVTLVNGAHLQRYITYVRGSRLTGRSAPLARALKLPPLSPAYLVEADGIPRRDPASSTVLAVANNKGGVAKTTTAADVATVLAERDHQHVLLVDMDGQASLTSALPLPGPRPPAKPPQDTVHLTDFFAGAASLSNVVRPTRFDHLWLIPADEKLLLIDSGGAGRPEDELRFMRALHDPHLVAPDATRFDWIILDTATAQSFYTRAALAASHYALLPAEAEVFAILGVQRALTTARTMRALNDVAAEPLGCLVTKWTQTAEAKRALTDLQDVASKWNTRVFKTKIPADYRVGRRHERTQAGGLAYLLRAIGNPGPAAHAYGAFVKEMLPYVHRA